MSNNRMSYIKEIKSKMNAEFKKYQAFLFSGDFVSADNSLALINLLGLEYKNAEEKSLKNGTFKVEKTETQIQLDKLNNELRTHKKNYLLKKEFLSIKNMKLDTSKLKDDRYLFFKNMIFKYIILEIEASQNKFYRYEGINKRMEISINQFKIYDHITNSNYYDIIKNHLNGRGHYFSLKEKDLNLILKIFDNYKKISSFSFPFEEKEKEKEILELEIIKKSDSIFKRTVIF